MSEASSLRAREPMTDREAFMRILVNLGHEPRLYDNNNPVRSGSRLADGHTIVGVDTRWSGMEIEFNAEGKAVDFEIYYE